MYSQEVKQNSKIEKEFQPKRLKLHNLYTYKCHSLTNIYMAFTPLYFSYNFFIKTSTLKVFQIFTMLLTESRAHSLYP